MKFFASTLICSFALQCAAQNVTLIGDFIPGPGHLYIENLTAVGDFALFIADDDITERELWRTDGTADGTHLVRDINPTTYSMDSGEPGFLIMNGIAYFIANDGNTGKELWRSDGTYDGTYLVKDIRPGGLGALDFSGFYDADFLVDDDAIYFTANDGIHGFELWRSDGTADGTYLVKDFVPGSGNGLIRYLNAAGDHIYFTAYNDVFETCLYISDGTEAGTAILKNNLYVTSNDPDDHVHFIEYNGYVYFPAGPDFEDTELWRTDGTPDGTQLFIEFSDEEADGGEPRGFLVFNGKFSFWTSHDGNKLHVSDGTVEGTHVLTDNTGEDVVVNDFGQFVPALDRIFFTSHIDGYPAIWSTDLTSENTRALGQFEFMIGGDETHTLVGNNIVFKSYEESAACYTVFKSDGTPEGTGLGIPCSLINYPDQMVTVNGKVIMQATDPEYVYGFELWLYEPDFTAAIDETKVDDSLVIYPNPAGDMLTVECGASKETITVINVVGDIVSTFTCIGKTSIALNNLPAGTYFIRVSGQTKKFIKL